MASSENLLPRPPSRGRIVPPEAMFVSPTKQQPFQRPSSPRIILQPIAAERGPGSGSVTADRIYLSAVKQDIASVCTAAQLLQRDLDMQRRPASSLVAKNALARRPLTPSAAAEPSAAFRSDGIDASLAKILAAADSGDGELVVVMLLLLLLHLRCFISCLPRTFRCETRPKSTSAGAAAADL